MFAWILILSLWVALLLLILHDATKEDSRGSAVSIAAKNLKAFIFLAIQKSISKPPAKVVTAVKAISSTSKPGETGENQQAGALPPKKNWWRKERRVPITISELELAISEDIKNGAPGCEDFVGVIVRHETPKTPLDPNWAILGVKFGKADRKMANEALATVVERMQRVFLLSDAKRRPP
jgi:hypothetical protein